ncbi:MAG TPA: hypothetical protein VNH64_01540 [Parvularculaceae bacterium]|nr:hypothetical protein [Parvularculaceae bacterium]
MFNAAYMRARRLWANCRLSSVLRNWPVMTLRITAAIYGDAMKIFARGGSAAESRARSGADLNRFFEIKRQKRAVGCILKNIEKCLNSI